MLSALNESMDQSDGGNTKRSIQRKMSFYSQDNEIF